MLNVLGISGSPVKDSNTDTLVKTILESTNVNQEFVKLSDINIGSCRACKNCVYTNCCVLDDDFQWLSQKVLDADALVIGSPVMYANVSGFTKAFIERLWSLRHVKQLTQGKIGATAVVGWTSTEDVTKWLNQVMMISGFQMVGSVIGHGSPGCLTCGPGETCHYSIWNSMKRNYEILKNHPETMENALEIEKLIQYQENIYEGYLEELPDNNPLKNPSYNILKCISVRDQPETMEKADAIGKIIGIKLKSKE